MKILRILGWTLLSIPVAAAAALFVAYWMSEGGCDGPPAGPPANPIQAIRYCAYGGPDVLELESVERPVPESDQLLVRVEAAAANPLDWHYMRGTPYVMRLESGLRAPHDPTVGVDFAGTVEAVGKDVTRFKPGDAIFGARSGAFAEYVAVRQDGSIAAKPPGLTFEQAAGINVAGITALQGLRRGGVGHGTRVLINGASGGVGTFAVQIAKAMGAHVTGVCSGRNVELVRSLGADEVIDYTRENYTEGERRFDVILDNVGNHGFFANRRALTPEGRYVLIGGGGPEDGKWIGPLAGFVKGPVLSRLFSQQMGIFISSLSAEDLETLAEMIEAGSVTPVIDRRYQLSEAAEAIRYLETGRARGKVVLTIGPRGAQT
jgi:NADPH:quinone reductase-like Zn-dependent oxidoreductase